MSVLTNKCNFFLMYVILILYKFIEAVDLYRDSEPQKAEKRFHNNIIRHSH